MAERAVTRAIIQNDEGGALVGLRARGIGANQWALIGGKPNEGETPEVAVGREVREELGVELIEPQFYLEKVDSDTDQENPWRVYFYTGRILGTPILKEDEILEVRYIAEADLDELDIAFDHRERLRDFFRMLKTT